MRSVYIFCLVLFLVQACLSGDESVPSSFLYLRINSFYGVVGGGPFVVSIKRSNTLQDLEDLTSQSEIFINGVRADPLLYPTEEGRFSVYAKYKKWTSETFTLTVRPNVQYDSISIPLIFHIIEPNEKYITQEDVKDMVTRINVIFENSLNPQHINTIPSRIFFRLSTVDSKGNKMSEPGVKRYREAQGYSNIHSYGNQISWDPNLYFNIVVEKSTVTSFAVYPPISTTPSPVFICFPASIAFTDGSSWVDVYKENSNYFYGNYITQFSDIVIAHEIGHSFGLDHLHEGCPYECTVPDVQYYRHDERYIFNGRDFGFKNCSGNYWVTHNNVMDYGAFIRAFTFDQVKTMRLGLDYTPWIKNLKNSDR